MYGLTEKLTADGRRWTPMEMERDDPQITQMERRLIKEDQTADDPLYTISGSSVSVPIGVGCPLGAACIGG
jgi:hypothetical protein